MLILYRATARGCRAVQSEIIEALKLRVSVYSGRSVALVQHCSLRNRPSTQPSWYDFVRKIIARAREGTHALVDYPRVFRELSLIARLRIQSPLRGCLHDPANVQQTFSKCIQNTRELLDVCWTFAGSCKHSIKVKKGFRSDHIMALHWRTVTDVVREMSPSTYKSAFHFQRR